MTVRQILVHSAAVGVHLTQHDGRLKATGRAIPVALKASLMANKADVVAVLWRREAMEQLHVEAPRAAVYARSEAQGGPGRCFSCGDPLGYDQAYGRCDPCDIAADLFYASQAQPEDAQVVA